MVNVSLDFAVDRRLFDSLVRFDGHPKPVRLIVDRPAPKESVDCWPLAINLAT